MGYKGYSTHKETPSRFFDKEMVSAFKEKQSSYPVVPKNGSTGKSQSDAVLPKNGTTGNSVKTAFSNFESSQKSHSDAVLPKNGSILINTINETDNEIINDTSLGFAQQTDAKKRKGNTGGFFEKKSPRPPLKLSTAFSEQKNAVAFFALHKGSSALSVNQRSRLSGR